MKLTNIKTKACAKCGAKFLETKDNMRFKGTTRHTYKGEKFISDWYDCYNMDGDEECRGTFMIITKDEK